ncbi:uncharacterized protein A1O5_04197 [Cladophialophora psammophila CBS 110553]|uniref:Uncharacterized protein n=1 Tax=Cladophialophora psammophila CBS 110553 TaxID=1182543 RepID=W9WYL7_9EURO|nr:uncharacterized protein A1O5_04197 [Cladophialophora psammophila CBS 110553]EXJ73048.1 hypothetical protein A1O5_04197 [Cladophialophora psammophila CBS 110553]
MFGLPPPLTEPSLVWWMLGISPVSQPRKLETRKSQPANPRIRQGTSSMQTRRDTKLPVKHVLESFVYTLLQHLKPRLSEYCPASPDDGVSLPDLLQAIQTERAPEPAQEKPLCRSTVYMPALFTLIHETAELAETDQIYIARLKGYAPETHFIPREAAPANAKHPLEKTMRAAPL